MREINRSPHTEETKKKISNALRGRKNTWAYKLIGRRKGLSDNELLNLRNKGRFISDIADEYGIDKSTLHRRLRKLGIKGHKGKKVREETKEKLRQINLKNGHMPPTPLRGSAHHSWKGGTTKLGTKIRNSRKYKKWVRDILKEFDYTCCECKERGVYLHVHHKIPFGKLLEKNKIKSVNDAYECNDLWDKENVLVLCVECHKETDSYLNRWAVNG